MKQSENSLATMRAALSEQVLVGFEAPADFAGKANLAESGEEQDEVRKSSVAKSGKSAAGKAASRPVTG